MSSRCDPRWGGLACGGTNVRPLQHEGLGREFLKDGEDVPGVGADAVVGVGFGEEDLVGAADDEGGGKGETPGVVALIAVDEGEVDHDGAVVVAEGLGDGVGDAEGFSETAAGVGEQGEGEVVALDGEVVLAGKLGGDGDEEGSMLADGGEGGLPGFELSHAVGTPAATKEADDERADGEQVGGVDELAVERDGGVEGGGGGVGEIEGRSGGADGEDAVLDAGGEEVVNGGVGDGETVRLDERAGLRGDVVEPGLEIGRVLHLYSV